MSMKVNHEHTHFTKFLRQYVATCGVWIKAKMDRLKRDFGVVFGFYILRTFVLLADSSSFG